jgi:hypothetical protein
MSSEKELLAIADKFAAAGDKTFARIFRSLAETARLDEQQRATEYAGG